MDMISHLLTRAKKARYLNTKCSFYSELHSLWFDETLFVSWYVVCCRVCEKATTSTVVSLRIPSFTCSLFMKEVLCFKEIFKCNVSTMYVYCLILYRSVSAAFVIHLHIEQAMLMCSDNDTWSCMCRMLWLLGKCIHLRLYRINIYFKRLIT